MMNKILLTGARVITMAENRPDVEDVDLLIEGGKILAIGDTRRAAGIPVKPPRVSPPYAAARSAVCRSRTLDSTGARK
ncbi:hypothetical protein [Burkholderia cenocepacia]|uniref:hypothetical protein n=1 Tax=Burkholderia cenocepacia TaxID=95486 RepID=UPI00158B2FED|nr:hypothetical protein [Burkholderia cenocepacia]